MTLYEFILANTDRTLASWQGNILKDYIKLLELQDKREKDRKGIREVTKRHRKARGLESSLAFYDECEWAQYRAYMGSLKLGHILNEADEYMINGSIRDKIKASIMYKICHVYTNKGYVDDGKFFILPVPEMNTLKVSTQYGEWKAGWVWLDKEDAEKLTLWRCHIGRRFI